MSGFHTTDLKRIVRVVHAVDPRREPTINFKDGVFGPPARAAFARLAEMSFETLVVSTLGAEIRIWPTIQSRVHSDKLFPDTYGDADMKITPHGHDLETKAVDTAVKAFLSVAHDRITEGHITALAESTKPALLDFLRELQGSVHAALTVDLATARSLTELYAGERLTWHADGITVHFPDGEIEGFMTSPNTTDAHRQKILERIDKALARAGIRKS